MVHVSPLMPLGGALSGNLPNPELVREETGLVISQQAYGKRAGFFAPHLLYFAGTPATVVGSVINALAMFGPIANNLGASIVRISAGTIVTAGLNASSSLTLALNSVVAGTRRLAYQTAGSNRWALDTDNVAESGGNAGANLSLARYDDAGVLIGNILSIVRSTGIINIVTGLTLGGAPVLTLKDLAPYSRIGHVHSYGSLMDVPVGGGGGSSATTVEVDLGTSWIFDGKFTVVDAAIGAASKVLVWQAPGPYTGKVSADEAAMAPVIVTAVVPAAGSAVVYWQTPPMITQIPQGLAGGDGGALNSAASPTGRRTEHDATLVKRLGRVRGNIKFSYLVFA